MAFFLFFILFSFGSLELEQLALNKIAEQLTKDRGAKCTAGNLTECQVSSRCDGISCGTFNVTLNSAKRVVNLF